MDRPAHRLATLATVTCAALAIGASAASARAPAPPPAPQAPATSALQRDVDHAVAAGVPGVVALVRDHGRTIRLTGGYADRRTKSPMRPSDRFRVGSITKTFVATVVLQLAGEGRLSLDDTVEHWLPGEVPGGAAITVRQLLTMTSGLYDYIDGGDDTVLRRELADPGVRWAPADLVAIAAAHAPRFAPGTSWAYSNTNYILLGQIVERAAGQPIDALLRARVFAPAGLRATSFETGPRIAGRHAHGYDRLGGDAVRDVSVLDQTWAWTAGAIVSNADDVGRLYRALLDGRLLRADLLQTMQTTVPMGGGTPRRYGYGAGLYSQPMPCGTAWGHTGSTPGYLASAFSSRTATRQVVLLINGGEQAQPARAGAAMQRLLVDAYCGG
jgi:D-alanyl-D-alanine carboxypeptidase